MEPTDTQIRDAAHAVLYEVALFIGLFARLSQGETSTDLVIRNACLEAWLLHARNLITFFETSQEDRRQDDIISEDYGFAARPLLITKRTQNRFNKDLAHLTFSRIARTRNTSESRKAKLWKFKDFSPLLKRCCEFAPHMQRDFPADPSDEKLLSECKQASSLLARLTKLRAEDTTG